ncbi:L-threonylcarbamoyladenylate synthase [Methanosphaera sp. ISO3-F5]|uniref:L-threonylcarbamoyladenylate synthase n=1 Tax=Methanosphaera sp. ISO3-F5 TaxID=1452353 RepID=UPI002B25EBD2|nr:L-threonylcarbamoyladenylate synthase [Methanosphaera sp. ISO3-F5]WQH65006.1 L-threonylcarbamoyladenylate synthase [Methanosphaera sp. ISO3-F5]
MKILNYNYGDNLEKIVEKLREGKIVVYPTDTIYGIAANITIPDAIKKVYLTKQRPLNKPLSVCFHDFEQLSNYVNLTVPQEKIIHQLLPGPYTLLLRKNKKISSIITGNSPILGVRIPNNTVSYELTEKFPITSTSANISNLQSPNNITQIKEQLGENIDYYIDAGTIKNNKSSTIIDLTKNKPQIIRKGVCDETLLKEILKINLR